MNSKQLVRVLALIASFYACQATAGSIAVSIDPPAGSLGDTFSLAITVEGRAGGEVSPPSIDGVEMSEGGKSSNVSIINGRMSSTATYYFHLLPTRAGEFELPSFTITVDGRQEMTQALHFSVHQEGGSGPAAGNPDELPMAFVERTVSKTDPFEGEALISTVKIYARFDFNNLQKASRDSPEFRYEEIGQSSGQERIGDKVYEVITYREALIPQKAGSLELTPYQIDAHLVVPEARGRRDEHDFFRGVFGRGFKVVKKRLASQPIPMTVRQLPEEGKPAKFQGVVGDFMVTSSLSSHDLKQGETATLTVTIEGAGLLDTLGQSLPLALPPSLKVYPDKPEAVSKANLSEAMHSRRTYKFALVPTKGGEVDLGTFRLPVFNPKRGTYEFLESDLGSLKVEAVKEERVVRTPDNGRQESTQSPTKAKVQALGKDLVDIHRDFKLASSPLRLPLSSEGELYWLVLVLALPPGAFTGSWLLAYWQRRRRGDGSALRRAGAYRRYKQQRKKAPPSVSTSKEESLADQYRAYRDYLGDKFNIHGGALTARDIAAASKQAGLGPEVSKRAEDIALSMDALTFAGKALTPSEASELSRQMDLMVEAIEKQSN